jgi:hypothetical protein
MNWRRGLFRIWIVISALWLLGTAAVAFTDTGIPSLTKDCRELLKFEDVKTGQKLGPHEVAQCDDQWRKERMRLIAIALGPPVTLLIVGLVLGWVRSGFRKSA